MSDGEKKVNKNMQYFLQKKRITRKFLKVSHCSCAKQLHRNVEKKVCCACKLAFLPIRPIVVFSPFSGIAFAA